MAEEGKTDASTQQQDGKGEAKTDAQNAADQKGAQGDGTQGTADGKVASAAGADGSGADKGAAGKTGADATKADDKKSGEGAAKAAESKAPDKYDLKLSDGSLLDQRTVDRIAAIARERGLSNEDAQTHLAAIETQAMKDRNEQVSAWNESLKADKDFGGEHHAASLANVQRYAGYLRKEYPDVIDVLERSGYTSHPAIAKYLRDMGAKMAEDKHEPAGGKGKGEKKPLHERLYGKTTPTTSDA